MSISPELLQEAAALAARYLASLEDRRVFPDAQAIAALDALNIPLPADGQSPLDVLRQLNAHAGASVASAGPRYFGFVTGGTLPAALAASMLSAAWDQNTFSSVNSPVGVRMERIAIGWLRAALGLPEGTDGAFVTGATMANFSGLLAARHALLARQGWDVEARGLFGAPGIRVVVGGEAHSSLFKALGMAGFGRERVERVSVDGQGRMRADQLPPLDERTLLCIQSGNVNTGAFDPAAELCAAARAAGAWVHVDGAFGIWATASPALRHLTAGVELADSWATDGHKWLNVSYDCGAIFVRQPEHLAGAFAQQAAYLLRGEDREPYDFTPEASRRARGIEAWAALLSLGQSGLADLIERNCAQARRMAAGLQAQGFAVLNEVVLNQVLVSFGDDDFTTRMIAALQAEGTFWAGSSQWQGRSAMRISFSSWRTTLADVDRCLEAVARVSARLNA